MRHVTAREANQAFSKILSAAAGGEVIIVTRRGKPVARICPVIDDQTQAERDLAIKKMHRLMKRGLHLGGNLWAGRDEVYTP